MSDDLQYKKVDDKWVQFTTTLQGEEIYMTLSDEIIAELNAEHPDADEVHRKMMFSEDTNKLLQKASELGAQREQERLQRRLDEAGLKDVRAGGGVIKLNNHNDSVNPETNHLKSVHDELDRLHREENYGNEVVSKNAKIQLDGLFEIMGRSIMEMTGEGITMVQCPKCNKPITTSETTVCGFCGFDLAGESGYARYGDITGGKRR